MRRFSNHQVFSYGWNVFRIMLLAVWPSIIDYGSYQNLQVTEEEEQVMAKKGAAEYAYEYKGAGNTTC